MRRADAREAAETLRRVLAAVERGELTATAMERNAIAGAAIGLDASTRPSGAPPRGTAPPA